MKKYNVKYISIYKYVSKSVNTTFSTNLFCMESRDHFRFFVLYLKEYMPYFQHLEPKYNDIFSEDELLDLAKREHFRADTFLSLREMHNGNKYASELAVRANQVINLNTLHWSNEIGLETASKALEPLYNKEIYEQVLDESNVNQLHTEVESAEKDLLDWVEQSVSEEDVKRISNFEYEAQIVSDLPKEDVGANEEAAFVVVNQIYDDAKHTTQKKLDRKLRKQNMKFVAVPDEEVSEFTNWLVQFKPLKGGNMDKIAKIQKKLNKKSMVEISAEKSVKKSRQMVSEPLANLLANQGHYRQAIEMYNRLILNFPEKSAYFAAQIEILKHKG